MQSSRTPYVDNTFFTPEQYLGEIVGVTRELTAEPQPITIRVDADQAPYVLTKPLHQTQQLLRKDPDGSVVIALTVIPNHELERTILGYGYHMEVLSPAEIRHNIANHTRKASQHYTDT